LKFEWDEAKAESNLKVHGVSFELAKTVFEDAFAIGALTIDKTTESIASSSSGWRRDRLCCS